jgi:peptidoglycan-N-acetylglucosamine deacetylase
MEERHFKGKISWPKGAQIAVVLSFDFQGGEGVHMVPEGNIYFEDYAQAEYGPKTGIWRLLRVLEEQGVAANFLICGGIVDRYPEAVRAVISKGHEVAGHGYHHEVARNLSREDEKQVIQRTTERIQSFSGKRPMGWRTCTQSPNTLELLMEHEYLWSSNSFSHDLPFLWMKDGRKLVELPRHPFGDGRIYGHDDFGTPRDALEVWRAAFDELYEESEAAPTFCPLTFHPYISSRPGRARVLGELIGYMKKHKGVWITTGSEVARCCLDQIVG